MIRRRENHRWSSSTAKYIFVCTRRACGGVCAILVFLSMEGVKPWSLSRVWCLSSMLNYSLLAWVGTVCGPKYILHVAHFTPFFEKNYLIATSLFVIMMFPSLKHVTVFRAFRNSLRFLYFFHSTVTPEWTQLCRTWSREESSVLPLLNLAVENLWKYIMCFEFRSCLMDVTK